MRFRSAMTRKESLYFLPIGGTAMAPLAGLLSEMGHRVEGVDAHLYPPMSTILQEAGIQVRLGFDPARMPAEIDRVIIGNAVPRSNPEVEAVISRGMPHLSQAEAVAHYVLAHGRDGLVVAGTHGKTTTSAMLAWILEHTGADPSYLVGGLPRWNPRGFRLGRGPHLVIEGDEYNSAFFDRGAKFLHYRPHLFLIGPVEFDHADLYPNLDAVLTAFRAGASLVPGVGAVVVNAWSEGAVAASRDAMAPVIMVGPTGDCDLHLRSWQGLTDKSIAELQWRNQTLELELELPGLHNLQNAAMAITAAILSGVNPVDAAAAMRLFPGVARRMEVVGEGAGVIVVDDFAHHPTALMVTIDAARQRWPDRRLIIAFEPRSLTAARKSSQTSYTKVLSHADVALIAPAFHQARLGEGEALDRKEIVTSLAAAGVQCLAPGADDAAADILYPLLEANDVVIGCSSGNFGEFHKKLLELLTGGES